MNEIIQDYGKTVRPDVYINALQGHQYIPQADECIMRIVKKHVLSNDEAYILDLGCGPGRLTWKLAQQTTGTVIGTDISEEFIHYANGIPKNILTYKTGKVLFRQLDFSQNKEIYGQGMKDTIKSFDIILMQGVMHHVHGIEREIWLKKCFDLLKPNGILVIGDEFIRDYKDEEQRKIFVAQFYCHIIHEALKGGFIELAKEEAKNLIDDAFSGTNYAGLATDETIKHIFNYCGMINQMFYTDGILKSEGYNQTQNLLRGIRESINNMTNDDPQKNFNRGDFKISIPKFIPEVIKHGFVLTERYKIGPVEQLGGMGVLVFRKY